MLLLCVHDTHGHLPRHFAVEPSADGSYFIDRSSKWFRCILDYLRNYQLSVDMFALSKTERGELRAELQFYGLASALEVFGMSAATFDSHRRAYELIGFVLKIVLFPPLGLGLRMCVARRCGVPFGRAHTVVVHMFLFLFIVCFRVMCVSM
jgi:hypothetical protein